MLNKKDYKSLIVRVDKTLLYKLKKVCVFDECTLQHLVSSVMSKFVEEWEQINNK